MPGRRITPDLTITWHERELRRFTEDPTGEIGRTLMVKIGKMVAGGAKKRALRRTGRMAAEITFDVGSDEQGLYVDIVSPVRNPRDGYPYAIQHESPKTRDRRPHRSLRPALSDVRKIDEGTRL